MKAKVLTVPKSPKLSKPRTTTSRSITTTPSIQKQVKTSVYKSSVKPVVSSVRKPFVRVPLTTSKPLVRVPLTKPLPTPARTPIQKTIWTKPKSTKPSVRKIPSPRKPFVRAPVTIPVAPKFATSVRASVSKTQSKPIPKPTIPTKSYYQKPQVSYQPLTNVTNTSQRFPIRKALNTSSISKELTFSSTNNSRNVSMEISSLNTYDRLKKRVEVIGKRL